MTHIDVGQYIRKNWMMSSEEQDQFKETLGNEWKISAGLFEREELGRFVSPESIRRTLFDMRLSTSAYARALEDVTRQLEGDSMFRRLWEHCWYLVYRSEHYDRWNSKQWQPFERCLGEDTGSFFLSVLLSHYNYLIKVVDARSIPTEVVEATLAEVTKWIRRTTDKAGRPSLDFLGMAWLKNHLAGRLFRLGRLAYLPYPFEEKLIFYCNRETDKIMAIPQTGLRFRSDGQYDGAGGWYDQQGVWVTEILESGGMFVSNAWISPRGLAFREEICLDMLQWEVILKYGDQALEFHIPGGEPLDHASCGNSFNCALEFFARHFPEITFRAINSGSWLFDPQLQDMLPSPSNLVNFQREMYLYPIFYSAGNESNILGSNYKTIDSAPQQTTLQRAVVKHLRAGGEMMAAGAVMFADDVADGCWGTQRYQSAV